LGENSPNLVTLPENALSSNIVDIVREKFLHLNISHKFTNTLMHCKSQTAALQSQTWQGFEPTIYVLFHMSNET
jgi:hypothetical protein